MKTIKINGWEISDFCDWMCVEGDYKFFAFKNDETLAFNTLAEAKAHARQLTDEELEYNAIEERADEIRKYGE